MIEEFLLSSLVPQRLSFLTFSCGRLGWLESAISIIRYKITVEKGILRSEDIRVIDYEATSEGSTFLRLVLNSGCENSSILARISVLDLSSCISSE